MNILMDVPVIVKILVSLAVILAADRLIKNLAAAMLTGTAVLAVWSGHSFSAIADIAFAQIISKDNIMLLIIVFMLISLSSQMKETNIMKDLVTGLRERLGGKTLLAVVPAVIGLIPMPGGAIFSAPLVEDCDSDKVMDSYLKTKINYWFRHIWEFWMPLYPGALLAIQITRIEIWQLAAINMPLSVFSIAGGYFFLLRKAAIVNNPLKKSDKPVLRHLIPVATIVSVYTILTITAPGLADFSRYLPMGFSILAAISITQLMRPLPANKWRKTFLSKNIFDMMIIIAIIGIYGSFIQARLPDGEFLMDVMRNELTATGFPPLMLIMLLPFISGFAIGIAVGFVGASFPIVISLLGYNPPLADLLSAIVIAYAFGQVGQLLSPVHVCNIVTNKYFKTDIIKSTAQLIPACLVILAGSFITAAAVRMIF